MSEINSPYSPNGCFIKKIIIRSVGMGGYSNSCSDQSNYLDIFKASLTALCKPQAGLEARKFVTRYFHSELGVVHSARDYVSCCVRHPCWLLISSGIILTCMYWGQSQSKSGIQFSSNRRFNKILFPSWFIQNHWFPSL